MAAYVGRCGAAHCAAGNAGCTNLPPFIDSALVLRIRVWGRGASGRRLNRKWGLECPGVSRRRRSAQYFRPSVPRQDHPRLCRRAGDLRRQHGFLLFWLRAGLVRGRVLPQQRHRGRSRPQHRPRAARLPLGRQIYFVVTGKEDDAKAALDAEAGLKRPSTRRSRAPRSPARQESLDKLAKEFPTSPRPSQRSSRPSATARCWCRTSSRATPIS